MRAIGMAVRVTKKRMTVAAVVLDDQSSSSKDFDLHMVSVETSFEVKGDQSNLAAQLGDAAKSISGRLRSLRPDVAVVRRADRPMKSPNTEGPRLRLLMDGAITAASHEIIPNTVIRDGKDCGAAYGLLKAELDAIAKGIQGGKFTEATAAALSALAENRPT